MVLARLLVCLLFALPCSVEAGTVVVDTTADDPALTDCADAVPNDCSLRGAILAANGRPLSVASTTISLPAGTYVLSQSSSCTYSVQSNPTEFFTSPPYRPLCLSGPVTIQGAGAATTIIDGGGRGRVLFVSASAVAQLRGVTIANGLGDYNFGNPRLLPVPNGGGIRNEGTLTLTDSAVRNNSMDPLAGAAGGAGIYNVGVLSLLRSRVSDNLSPSNDLGAGILNSQAILTVSDSTIINNEIGSNGGGICNLEGTATITNSTISGNSANNFSGGGIANFGGNLIATLTVINSTISGNTSRSSGAGIFNGARTKVFLNNVTITSNASGDIAGGSGGGVESDEETLTLQNTIIALNGDALSALPTDCSTGTRLISQGYNLIQNTSGCIITGDLTGNIIGQDPRLGVLLDNGGLTETHALADGSPAIDAGNPTAPGSGGAACAATDQRGFLRPRGAACDIGAVERGRAFALSKIVPNSGGNIGSVSALLSGDGFVSGTTVTFTRAGEPDIVANPVQSDVGGSALAATFDLSGRALGPWDVVVRNPDGTSKTLAAGFTIEAGRAPELWVDVIERSYRDGRPSRHTILYGNRGNVDALAVSLSISIPSGYGLSAAFALTSPPPQAGQINVNWSQVPVIVQADAQHSATNVPLLLPVVPAGFTGTLPLVLLLPPGAPASTGFIGIDSSYFNPILNPQIVSGFVQGAQAYAQQGFDVTIPPALVPDLEQYVTNQLQLVVNNGRDALVASLGTVPQVYSVSQLQLDTALFGARLALTSAQVSAKPHEAPNWLSTAYRLFVARVSPGQPAEAQAQTSPICTKAFETGCTTGGGPDIVGPPPIPAPPGCDPDKIKEKLKTLTGTSELLLSPPECKITPAHCEALPGYHVITYADGSMACVPNKCTNNSPISGNCRPYPIRPARPQDPNDKAGSLGVTPVQFLLSATPLSYAIHFENLATAAAAAQEVVITDQLNVQTLDLDTFSFGPLSFGGEFTLVPAPGVQQYSGGVDLRPEQNLIVTITAILDKTTGVITWRFTSIDPGTGQFTDDPDAGFLPPNVSAPEGEGSVVFTVQAKPGLATGTEIRNQARIVFDTNAPIDTPEWLNTVDASAPSSQVRPLTATQPITSFLVEWAGTDAGAGIRDYSIFVSVDAGPFTAFLSNTATTSAMFSADVGKRYAFYSLARDLVGNEELPPTSPDTRTRVGIPDCVGDCNDDGTVKVNELITGVNIALDKLLISECPSFDASGNDHVEVNELVRGVHSLLQGCPSQ